MPALTLPLTFTNSFWSQDYRRGLETLYTKLEQGVEENEEIVAFIRARVAAENVMAASLSNPSLTGPQGRGFGADEGASLLMAFRGLQAESIVQGEKHRTIANELETLVVDPFEGWAQGHKERVLGSRARVIDNWLKAYELAQGDVEKFRHIYLSKMRRADEAEDDAKFAPNNDLGDKYTTSPRLGARDVRPPQRTASVSERIAQRLKDIQKKPSKLSEEHSVLFDGKSPTSENGEDEKPLPKVDKGKGKAVEEPLHSSPPPLSPPLPPSKLIIKPPSPMPPAPPSPILLAGLSLPASAVSDLLRRAVGELPLRPVKIPILGEYQDCFTGEEFTTWLVENIQGLGGSLDRAEDAARDLTEREGVLRRIGELGNKFENSDEAHYQFRQKAFDLQGDRLKAQAQDNETTNGTTLSPMTENLVKRSNTFVSLVSKALTANASSEPPYVRARAEADAADKTYRVAVRKLDRQRLSLEERIEETLKLLQKWETDRLRAVKTVLLQYQGTLQNLPTSLQPSLDRSSTLLAAYQPDSDLKALIERYRTGPFRPTPQLYESVTHDESDVMFGIDLRKWAEGGWNGVRGGEEKKDKIPEVVTALLGALTDAYTKLPTDGEKRKTWIYEVPLSAVHHLREAINTVSPGRAIPSEMLSTYDAPVIASTLKLWALELNPPLGTWEGWEDIRRVYPIVGVAKMEEGSNDQQHLQDLQVALQRLPKVHLLVLDSIASHLKSLIDSTTVEESNEVYITKLALSMGRTILRPKLESELSIQDRHPTLMFIDLLSRYNEILPPTILRKKCESDRRLPIRKRTAPIDQRMSRSRLSVGVDAHEVLAAQLAAKNPNMKIPSRASSPTLVEALKVQPLVLPAESAPGPSVAAVQAAPIVPSPHSPKIAESIPVAVVEEPKDASEVTDVAPLMHTFVEPVLDLDNGPLPMPRFAEQPAEPAPPPTRPNFVEPPMSPPPTRPNFVEPPVSPPPARPNFVEPPISPPPAGPNFAEAPPGRDAVGLGSPTEPIVVPPTPRKNAIPSPSTSDGAQTPPNGRATPTSPRPTSPLAAGDQGANLNRSSSGDASRVRGPRMVARGPRPQSSVGGAGNVASMAAAFNRNGQGQTSPAAGARLNRSSIGSRPVSIVNPQDYEPKKRSVNRTSAGAFSRRTMASDAEDEVVEK